MQYHSRPHPPDRILVELADGELSWIDRPRVLAHLLFCGSCRRKLGHTTEEKRVIRQSLLPLSIDPRSEDAWARLVLLHTPPNTRRLPPAVLGLAASLLFLFGVYHWSTTPKGPTAEFLAAIERLPSRPDLLDAPAARQSRQDSRFIIQLLALTRNGEARVVRDDCCDDHDGEGPADDGIFAAQLPEAQLAVHVMYDDADGTHTLSPGDLVRSVARSPLEGHALAPVTPSALLALSQPVPPAALTHAQVLNP